MLSSFDVVGVRPVEATAYASAGRFHSYGEFITTRAAIKIKSAHEQRFICSLFDVFQIALPAA